MPLQTLILVLLLFFFLTTAFTFILFQDTRSKLLYLQGKLNPFKRKAYFLTGNEKKLFSILRDLPKLKEYYIFPQLHLSTLLEVKDDADDMTGKFDWINKLFVDFVIFDEDLNPMLVIELNDSTHKWNNRKARDQFVKKALAENQIKLLEIETNLLSLPENISERVSNALV